MLKRRNSSGDSQRTKRPRLDSGDIVELTRDTLPGSASQRTRQSESAGQSKAHLQKIQKTTNSSGRREIINKLAPPRPFPNVPSSVSANGPKSSHREGKNFICITRHTPLAAYLNRCKKLLVDEGYQSLHLHAMGAAIPHLLTLTVSLPPILPFSRNEITTQVRTGTIEVMDEIIPEDEGEDISFRTRDKGGVSVILNIGDGQKRVSATAKSNQHGKASRDKGGKPRILIIPELEQDDELVDAEVMRKD